MYRLYKVSFLKCHFFIKIRSVTIGNLFKASQHILLYKYPLQFSLHIEILLFSVFKYFKKTHKQFPIFVL